GRRISPLFFRHSAADISVSTTKRERLDITWSTPGGVLVLPNSVSEGHPQRISIRVHPEHDLARLAVAEPLCHRAGRRSIWIRTVSQRHRVPKGIGAIVHRQDWVPSIVEIEGSVRPRRIVMTHGSVRHVERSRPTVVFEELSGEHLLGANVGGRLTTRIVF